MRFFPRIIYRFHEYEKPGETVVMSWISYVTSFKLSKIDSVEKHLHKPPSLAFHYSWDSHVIQSQNFDKATYVAKVWCIFHLGFSQKAYSEK